MLNKNPLIILILIIIILISGCSTKQYISCKNNLSDVKEKLNTCEEKLKTKQEVVNAQLDINKQLKSNETYVIQNTDFNNVKKVYLEKNYFLSLTYETVINIIFYFQLTLTLSVMFVTKIRDNIYGRIGIGVSYILLYSLKMGLL